MPSEAANQAASIERGGRGRGRRRRRRITTDLRILDDASSSPASFIMMTCFGGTGEGKGKEEKSKNGLKQWHRALHQ